MQTFGLKPKRELDIQRRTRYYGQKRIIINYCAETDLYLRLLQNSIFNDNCDRNIDLKK